MKAGDQRLSLEKLHAWEALGFGMFIHFGMSTFDGAEHSKGNQPASFYSPDHLDVAQWVSVARDAGMKYAILTAKHVAGFCLWPSAHTDYHVGHSGNKTDVVEVFVSECQKKGLMPGFYYCSWDNHHLFGSGTPTFVGWENAYTTREYRDFQTAQVEELLTRYGGFGEVWIDIPKVLPRDYRHELYDRVASLQPDALIVMNHGCSDGSKLRIDWTWPTDLITIERFLPNSQTGHDPWRTVEEKEYYLPGEACDPIGKNWFFIEGDRPRSDSELLGMYLISLSRGANLLLDVGPDRHGLIPEPCVKALRRLAENIGKVGAGKRTKESGAPS
ncbi:alpha-L-fucosidase [bacterium]|nr:alpha-L-fucosidase [bacterium]